MWLEFSFSTECFLLVLLFMSFVDYDCDVSPFSKLSSAFGYKATKKCKPETAWTAGRRSQPQTRSTCTSHLRLNAEKGPRNHLTSSLNHWTQFSQHLLSEMTADETLLKAPGELSGVSIVQQPPGSKTFYAASPSSVRAAQEARLERGRRDRTWAHDPFSPTFAPTVTLNLK